MKILLIGATGMIGSRVTAEALGRGHEVTAATRSGRADTVPEHQALTVLALDATVPGKVAQAAAGHDAVISAVSPPRDGSDPAAPLLATYTSLVEGLRIAGVHRLLVVGGAGSLKTASGQDRVDTPDFPQMYKAESLAQREVLRLLRAEVGDDWTGRMSPRPTRSPPASAPAPSASAATTCSSRRTAPASSAPRTTRSPSSTRPRRARRSAAASPSRTDGPPRRRPIRPQADRQRQGGTSSFGRAAPRRQGHGITFVDNPCQCLGHPALAGPEVRVRDDGPGFPPELLAVLRASAPQRFCTGSPAYGTGLGLTIAVGQARLVSARLSFRNRPEGGAEAVLRLPADGPDSDRTDT